MGRILRLKEQIAVHDEDSSIAEVHTRPVWINSDCIEIVRKEADSKNARIVMKSGTAITIETGMDNEELSIYLQGF